MTDLHPNISYIFPIGRWSIEEGEEIISPVEAWEKEKEKEKEKGKGKRNGKGSDDEEVSVLDGRPV
jgi:hypothetical protein